MFITLFISSLYGGGAERVTCNLANYLVQQGHIVEVLTMSETEKTYEIDKKVKIKTLLPLNNRKNKIWNTFIRFPRLWAYLFSTNNDVYVVMLPKLIILLLMFKWMTCAKVIAAERADPNAYSRRIANHLKKVAKKADGFVFQTENAKMWYADAVKDIETVVIPNAINNVFFRPPYLKKKRKIIAGAGRLTQQKNFPLLINAFAEIAEDFSDYNLVIYGEGQMRGELEKIVVEKGLDERVKLPGNVNNIADEMEKNTLFVLTSNYEGMPNALMEAMALGLPCISTDCPCGGPQFLIKDGVNGVLVPVNNTSILASKMRELLSNDSLMKRMGYEAHKICETLDPNTIYGRWESFIENTVIAGAIK